MKIYIGNINDYTTEYLTHLVSGERTDAAMKYRFEADRKRTLLAHALLNHAVSLTHPDMTLPVSPVTDEYGKPHLYFGVHSSSEIHFSLSHSGDYSVCAVSSHNVGVDIEKIGDDKERIADRFFAEEEREYIQDAAGFYRIWTLKESFMKAVGWGMKLPLDAFSVSGLDENTGICSFRPCKSRDDDNKDINEEIAMTLGRSVTDKKTGYYTISGRALSVINGYSLAYSLCFVSPLELKMPDIVYPIL